MSSAALAVNDQIRECRLRSQPLSWTAIEHEFNLTRKERVAHQWLSAARIKAEHERRTFKAIAGDPTVGLRADTLRRGYATAKLPTGQTWGEFIAAYREGAFEKLAELQRAEGAAAAEELYELLKKGQKTLAIVQDNLLQYAQHPPETITIAGMMGPVEIATKVQMSLTFPGVEPDASPVERLTFAFMEKVLAMQERTFKCYRPLEHLLSRVKPAEGPREEERILSPAELAAKLDEIDLLREELELYEEAAA